MAIKIAEEQIIKINELYLEIGVKSKVAKLVGCSPATVTKYIIPNYVPQNEIVKEEFDMDIPQLNLDLFKGVDNWGDLCVLSKEEENECDELRKEILI